MTAATVPAQTVTLVTQTRILPDRTDEFVAWQQQLLEAVSQCAGFMDQSSIPPAPPVQLDWVISQRFETIEAARVWLQSEERQRLLNAIQPQLIGPVDVHLFNENESRSPNSPVSVVISTKVKPGQEADFLRWQRRVAAIEAKFEGFQGYKIEPPMAGVQDDWVMLVRFDSDVHLEAWLNSEQRKQLLAESTIFDADTHVRKIQSGFETWFTSAPGESPPPGWKMNMLVLLGLYPIVFLFGRWVSTPHLTGNGHGVPFWLALFIGNVVSTVLLGYGVVTLISRGFTWWLQPSVRRLQWRNLAGTGAVVALYGVCMLIFSRFP